METRRRGLPTGWYPDNEREIVRLIAEWGGLPPEEERRGLSGVAPHAGWFFSGALAWKTIRSLAADAGTVAVIGGHLGVRDGIVAAEEGGFKTPFGTMGADTELLERLAAMIGIGPDRAADNTVEIQIPLVRYAFPNARLLWLRCPPSGLASELGRGLSEAAAALGRKVVVVGSTDLTHYGSSYGFQPAGSGKEGLRWMREVNDRRFLDALLSLDEREIIDRGVRERSACSAGGAAAACAFAKAEAIRAAGSEAETTRSALPAGILLGYRTSYDLKAGNDFVGYGSVLFSV
jgi:AmmeMemoRadiSam system protein B